MAARPYKAPPPVVAPIYDGSGFYIGANGGWGNSHNCWDFVTLAGTVFRDGCRDRSGGLIGGPIRDRWQSNQFLFGFEAQGDWAEFSSSRISVPHPNVSTPLKNNLHAPFTGENLWEL